MYTVIKEYDKYYVERDGVRIGGPFNYECEAWEMIEEMQGDKDE